MNVPTKLWPIAVGSLCSNGHAVPAGQSFCGSCGVAVVGNLPPPSQALDPTPWAEIDPSLFVPRPKRKRTGRVVALSVLGAVVVGAGGVLALRALSDGPDPIAGAGGPGGEVVPTTIDKKVIKGSLTLIDYKTASNRCEGEGGYSDIDNGMSITLKNEVGTILATDTTSTGRVDELVSCVYDFELTDVPEAKFYVITLGSGRRGDLTYSSEDMVRKGNRVDIVLT